MKTQKWEISYDNTYFQYGIATLSMTREDLPSASSSEHIIVRAHALYGHQLLNVIITHQLASPW